MEHSLQKTAQKGGQVQDAVKIGDSSLTITSGVVGDKSNDYKGGKGSVHQFEKHGKGGKGKEQTSFRKVAKAAVLGEKSKDREKNTVLSDHHTTQAVYANKPKHTADFISGYKRKKPKSGTRAH